MNLFKSIVISLFLLCSGCVSVIEHCGNEVYYPYNPTVDEFTDFLCIWWKKPTCADNQIGISWVELTYLVWIIDFPCEIVADTICLPYDIFFHNVKKSNTSNRDAETETKEIENEETTIHIKDN